MEHFDTTTMSYMPMAIPMQTVTGPDQQLAMPMVPVDQYDQRSAFDAETFIGYANFALPATAAPANSIV